MAHSETREFSVTTGGAVLCGELSSFPPEDGPAAVFLHGTGGDRHTWDDIWDRLTPPRPAIRYDLRGFGASTSAVDSQFDHAADLAELLDNLRANPVDVIGLSMGGAVALHFALDYPERVRKLVLISPAIAAWDWSDEWRARWEEIAAFARSGRMDLARKKWAAHPMFGHAMAGPAASRLLEEIERYSGRQWIEDLQAPLLPDVDRLPFLEPQTLLLTGAEDLPDFRLMAGLIEGAAPNVTRIDVPSCGHMLPYEAPDTCRDAIGAFLSEPGRGESAA